jgi:hypothetical protein
MVISGSHILTILLHDCGGSCRLRPLTKYSGGLIKEDEMGGACDTYVGDEKYIPAVGGDTWRKDTTWEI